MFEEPKKEKKTQSLIKQDKTNRISFKTIREAIAKALGKNDR